MLSQEPSLAVLTPKSIQTSPDGEGQRSPAKHGGSWLSHSASPRCWPHSPPGGEEKAYLLRSESLKLIFLYLDSNPYSRGVKPIFTGATSALQLPSKGRM